jgi:hypothetical protein
MARWIRITLALLLVLLATPWSWRVLHANLHESWFGWPAGPCVMFTLACILFILLLISEISANHRLRRLAADMNHQLTAAGSLNRDLEERLNLWQIRFESEIAERQQELANQQREFEIRCDEQERLAQQRSWKLDEQQKQLDARKIWMEDRETHLQSLYEEYDQQRSSRDIQLREQRLKLDKDQQGLNRERREFAEQVKRHEADLVLRLGKLREEQEHLVREQQAFEQARLVWADEKHAAQSSLKRDRDEHEFHRSEFAQRQKLARADLDAKTEYLEARIAQFRMQREEWELEKHRRERQLGNWSNELQALAAEFEHQQHRQAAELAARSQALDEWERLLSRHEAANRDLEHSLTERQRRWENELAQRSAELEVIRESKEPTEPPDEAPACGGWAEYPTIAETDDSTSLAEYRGDMGSTGVTSVSNMEHVFLDDDEESELEVGESLVEDSDDEGPPIAYRLRILGHKRRNIRSGKETRNRHVK